MGAFGRCGSLTAYGLVMKYIEILLDCRGFMLDGIMTGSRYADESKNGRRSMKINLLTIEDPKILEVPVWYKVTLSTLKFVAKAGLTSVFHRVFRLLVPYLANYSEDQ